MSSKESTPSVTPVPPPVNPAKGNKRGQTTLAAEIDRWQALADNLAPQVDQMPALKDAFAQFQSVLATAKAVRNQLNTLRANTDMAVAERQQMLVDGGNLYSHLTLGLQFLHGARSPRLREFGLKPRRVPPGRPRKTPTPPTTEVTTTPATPVPPVTTEVTTTPAK